MKKLIAWLLIALIAVGGKSLYTNIESKKQLYKNKTNIYDLQENNSHNNIDNDKNNIQSPNIDNAYKDSKDIINKINNMNEEDAYKYYSKFEDASNEFFNEEIYKLPGMEGKKEDVKDLEKEVGIDKIDKNKLKKDRETLFKWVFRNAKKTYNLCKEIVVDFFNKKTENKQENKANIETTQNDLRKKEAEENIDKQKENTAP